jgi:hypothetical protein
MWDWFGTNATSQRQEFKESRGLTPSLTARTPVLSDKSAVS